MTIGCFKKYVRNLLYWFYFCIYYKISHSSISHYSFKQRQQFQFKLLHAGMLMPGMLMCSNINRQQYIYSLLILQFLSTHMQISQHIVYIIIFIPVFINTKIVFKKPKIKVVGLQFSSKKGWRNIQIRDSYCIKQFFGPY